MRIKSGDLYSAFKQYYNGSAGMNQKEFKEALINKGLKPTVLKGYNI